jgi:hypothetical protein
MHRTKPTYYSATDRRYSGHKPEISLTASIAAGIADPPADASNEAEEVADGSAEPCVARVHPAAARLMTTRQVSDLFRVSVRTLFNWRRDGRLSPIRMTRRSLYYRETDGKSMYCLSITQTYGTLFAS